MATRHRIVLNKIISDSLSSEDIRRNCTENRNRKESVESGNVFRVELIFAYLLVRECMQQRLAGKMGEPLANYIICIVEEVAVYLVPKEGSHSMSQAAIPDSSGCSHSRSGGGVHLVAQQIMISHVLGGCIILCSIATGRSWFSSMHAQFCICCAIYI